MPKIINSVDVSRMRELETNKELINLDYLNDQGNELTRFISDMFFEGDSIDPVIKKKGQDKLKLLNHTIALPYKITTIKAKFFGKPNTNLIVDELKEHVIAFVYGGFTVFAIDEILEDGTVKINRYNPEQYIKGLESDKIVTYLRDDNNNSYAFIKEFSHTEKGLVRNNLYKITGDITAGISGVKVPLDTLDQTAHLEDEDNFETDEKLIYTVHDYKLKNSEYGTPQITMVKSLLNQLNIELVNIKDQFMKHLQAKLALQGIEAGNMPKDEEGNIDIRKAEAIFLEIGAAAPQYISNKNELLTEVVSILDKYIGWIATTLSVPKELVGLSGQTGTESTESKLLRYAEFTKDIEEIHAGFKKVFEKMFEVVSGIDKNFVNSLEDKEFNYIASPVMPKDGQALATELATAKTAGFLSNITAVKRYTGYEGKELQEELDRIAEEEARSISNVDIF